MRQARIGSSSMLVCGTAWFLVAGCEPPPEEPLGAGTWQGQIDTLVVDNFEEGTSQRRLFLNTGAGSVELFGLQDVRPGAGATFEVSGALSTKGLTAKVALATTAAPASTTCSAIGQQKVAIILASLPSKPLLSSVTPALLSASFFGSGRTVDTFLRESSFNTAWITGDVLGPYVLDGNYPGDPIGIRDAALRAAAPHATLKNYSRFIIVAPQGQSGMDSGGMALIGCGQISTPQGTLTASSIWMGAESLIGTNGIVDIATHELGHGFGLEHARFADYGTDVLGPPGQAPAAWDQLHDYGDSFSSMGRNSGQWAAPHKSLIGWLQSNTNIKTVTSAGSYNVPPYELAGTGQALRVARGAGTGTWLWVEYRQPRGTFDATLTTQAFAGASIHYEDPVLTASKAGESAGTYTNLINFHPAVAYANDPTLHVGDTWKDPYGIVSLTVTSASATGLNINVAYAPAPTCPGALSQPQTFAATGGATSISVTALAKCSWSSNTSASWITLGSKSAGAGNGAVTFTVAPNPNVSPRWATITIGAASVTINQAGSTTATLTLDQSSATVVAKGGTGQISVTSSASDLAWTYNKDVPWITDVEASKLQTVGSATLRYLVGLNTGTQRTGHISIGTKVFVVTQLAAGPTQLGVIFADQAPRDAPTARLGQAMAPFGHSGQAILFGGAANAVFSAVTWRWDGSNWTALSPAQNPGLVAEHAMAYDDSRGRIVLFGGTNGTTHAFSNDTWEWNGTNWTHMHPQSSPPARYNHAMAYDSVAKKIVMFGGYGNYGESNDTWTYDGINWTNVASAISPPARSGHSMAFDTARGQMVMFGGLLSNPTPAWYSDTWLRDANGWHQASTTNAPVGRTGHLLAYHSAMKSVVMIGGNGGKDISGRSWNYDFRRETWVWDGRGWIQQFPQVQPGPAYTLSAAYDDVKQGLVVHLGDDLTCASRGPKTFLVTGTPIN